MEARCQSRRQSPLSRCGALGFAAVLLLSACASSPESPQTTDGQNAELQAETNSVSRAPRGVYTPSLRQVVYTPQSSEDAPDSGSDGGEAVADDYLVMESGPALQVANAPQTSEGLSDVSSDQDETASGGYLVTATDPALFANNANDNEASSVQLALGETRDDDDPLEGLNRYFYDVNNAFDYLIFRQFAEAYRLVVPDGVKRSITNFIRFVKTPVILANDLLQGDMDRAGDTLGRFVVNAAIGFGMFDVASDSGLPYQEQDFGQTLAVWGVDSGPYLVLPLLGPSTVRDGVGIGVDILLDPFTYVLSTEAGLARFGVQALDARERNLDTLDEIRRDALDEYARVRSLWLQNRRDTIEKGRIKKDDDKSQENKETAALSIFETNDRDGYLVVDVDQSR